MLLKITHLIDIYILLKFLV